MALIIRETQKAQAEYIETLQNCCDSLAGIDTSFSTNGRILDAQQSTILDIIKRGKYCTWSSKIKGPFNVASMTNLEADGGTVPTLFLEKINDQTKLDAYILTTDGQVSPEQVRKMGTITDKSHIPSLLILFDYFQEYTDISQSNISVLLPSFNMAIDTALIIYNMNTNQLHLIKSKGRFAQSMPPPPPIEPNIILNDFPKIDTHQLKNLPIYKYPPAQSGTIRLDDNRLVDINTFMHLDDPKTIMEFETKDLYSIISILHTQGCLKQARVMFNRLDLACKNAIHESSQDVSMTTNDSDSNGSMHLDDMMDKLSSLSSLSSSVDGEKIRQELLEKILKQQQDKAHAKNKAKDEQKDFKSLIQYALETITRLENAGYTASALNNRAKRANNVSPCKDLSTLDSTAAPQFECLILLEKGPMAIMCRKMKNPEKNISSDDAMTFGLCTGKYNKDVICNAPIGIAAADMICINPFTREAVDFIPIVSLKEQNNKTEVFKRLCNIFMGGKALRHVWLIALAAFVDTIRTAEWAAPGTTIHDCLVFMIHQIMDNVKAPQGSFINPNAECSIKDAIETALLSDIMQEHYPYMGVITSLWLNKLNPSDKSRIKGRQRQNILIARMHALIVTTYLSYLKNGGKVKSSPLWTKLFEVRIDEHGIFQPILKTGHLIDTLDCVLAQQVIKDLDTWMHENHNDKGADGLIRPSTSAVIINALRAVTPFLKPSDAIAKVANVVPVFQHTLVDVITKEDVESSLEKVLTMNQYSISILPPFSHTGMGPPVLFFYDGDQIINMAEGSKYYDSLPTNEKEWFEFTEFIRQRRKELLDCYQQYNEGTFKEDTNATILHKAMVHVRSTGIDPETTEYGVKVLQSIMESNLGAIHSRILEVQIAMLIPSLMATPYLSMECLNENKSLESRIKIELDGKPPNQHVAQPGVWIPDDSKFKERIQAYRSLMNEKIQQHISQHQSSVAKPIVKLSKMDNKQASHAVTTLLRHSISHKLISPAGWVKVYDIIEIFKSRNKEITLDQLNIICQSDRKMRFSMQETNGEFYMRANNGHKITKIDASALMETITIDDVPAAIHGTSIKAWESIKLTGLHPMERNCVQMASGLPDDPLVKSGIRKTSEIYIWVNLAMAIQDGFRFYRSDNGVICSPNVIPSKYFSRVENVKTRELIL